MDSDAVGGGGRRGVLAAILVLSALVRLHHWHVPLLDQMYVKQIYVANKARNIARAPLAPLRDTLDFLDDRGERMHLAEEVPLYPGLLGACYAAFGEREWLGRALSLAATLVAIAALHDLLRREVDRRTADVGALLFAFTPLLIFYGRAVIPDPAMLACMLAAACCYRRHLDGGKARWLIAAALAALLGATFKYYGLMVLVPLADMARRRAGTWRACLDRRFLALAAVAVLPVALWVALVFARMPNPSGKTPYYLVQTPGILLRRRLYQALLDRFFLRDSGPITAALALVGCWAAWRGKVDARPVYGWTAMGLVFMVLLAPKTSDHDYYELMALPAVAGWGALGWVALRGRGGVRTDRRRARAWAGAAVLASAVVVHSPWGAARVKYEQNVVHLVLAERLDRLCSPTGRFIVIGQEIGWPVVHYSGREGWVLQDATLRPDWRETFARYRALGAEFVGLCFDPTVSPARRATFGPLPSSLPVVEHRVGPWFCKGKPCEYYILSLRDAVPVVGTAPRRGVAR